MDPFIGEIVMFGGNFAPRGWALCDGQLLSISQFQALFSILGTTYGGDGRTTFALPDLRGRASMHPGSGAGLTTRHLGERVGTETVTLNVNEIPAHKHGVQATNANGNQNDPQNNILADEPAAYSNRNPQVLMNADMITNTGGGGAHDNVQPCLCVNYIIALQGTFPSRN